MTAKRVDKGTYEFQFTEEKMEELKESIAAEARSEAAQRISELERLLAISEQRTTPHVNVDDLDIARGEVSGTLYLDIRNKDEQYRQDDHRVYEVDGQFVTPRQLREEWKEEHTARVQNALAGLGTLLGKEVAAYDAMHTQYGLEQEAVSSTATVRVEGGMVTVEGYEPVSSKTNGAVPASHPVRHVKPAAGQPYATEPERAMGLAGRIGSLLARQPQ